MKLKKSSGFLFLICFLLVCPLYKSLAQQKIFAQANKEYQLQRYKTAVPYYLKGLRQDSLNQQAIENLADCYRRLRNYENAEIWYAKAVLVNPGNAYNSLHYAEVLANNNKYEAAETWYRKYLVLNNADVKANATKYTDRSRFFADSASWRIRFTSLNTSSDEFSPVFFRRGLIITSNYYDDKIKHISGADSEPFTNLFYITDTADIKLTDTKSTNIKVVSNAGKAVNDNRSLGNFNVKYLTKVKYNNGYTPLVELKGALKTKLNDGPVSIPADESWMMLTRNRPGSSFTEPNKLQMFSVRFNGESWGRLESFPYNSNKYSVGQPALSDDGNVLYFVSNMPGGYGGTDLYYCLRKGFGWSTPVNLGEKVNTEGDEMFPFLDSRGKLFFSSTGLPGLGGLDIFSVAIKDYLPSGFPENLGYPVNSSKDDFGIIVKSDGSSGYFSSDRRGDDDIYRFDYNSRSKSVRNETLEISSDEPAPPDKTSSEANTAAPVTEAVNNVQTAAAVQASDNIIRSAGKPVALKSIEFAEGKASVPYPALQNINVVADLLADKSLTLSLIGHADFPGSSAANMKLARDRAEFVKAYLVSRGADPSRIQVRGTAAQVIAGKNISGEKQVNRCVEVILY